jgi:hypothetical protein
LSTLVAGLLLSIVLAGVGVVVLNYVRSAGSRVVDAGSGSPPGVLAYMVEYNSTHYLITIYNYGSTTRENARIVGSDGGVYSLGALAPGRGPVSLLVPRTCGEGLCTYFYVDSRGQLIVKVVRSG